MFRLKVLENCTLIECKSRLLFVAKITFIWQAQDHTGSELLNIPDYQMVPNYRIFWIIRWYPYWRKFLQVVFCYCSYTWSVQDNQSQEYSIWISPSSAGSGSSGLFSKFPGVFIAEEVGVQDKGSGDTAVYVQVLLEACLNMFLRSACFIDKAFFLVKSKTSGLETAVL